MNRSVQCRLFQSATLLLIGLLLHATAPAETPVVSAVLQSLPAEAKAGDVVELQLKLTISDPWHVYGQFPGDGGQQPMGLRLKLPEGVQAVDGWVWPPMSAVLYPGEHVLKQKLRITTLPDPAQVKLMLTYQACNAQLCLPVEMVELDVTLEPGGAVPGNSAPESVADRDFKAFERELKPLYEGFGDTDPGYKSLNYPEQLRAMDRQRRKIFAAGEAFVLQHPADERVFNVLQTCFPRFYPFFFEQDQVLSPELNVLWESRKTAKTEEEKDSKYGELMGRMPKDPAAEANWLKRGNAMVAAITAAPGISRENREQAEFLLLARWIMTSEHKQRYQAVEWSAFYPLFATHVRKYKEMELMGVRANDVLGAMRRSSPDAAEAGWKYLLANGDGSSAGAKAIETSAAAALESIEIARSGKKFEALKFTALDGRAIDLAALRGKVVLIDFWATWCKPCVEEMPAVKALYETYRAQGLEVIGISGDSGTAEQLKAFLKRGGYEWPQHFDGRGTSNYFAQLFAIKSWPTTYLLDRAGNQSARNLRGAPLEAAIKQLLAPQ